MNHPFQPAPSYSFSVAKKIQSHFLLPQISMGPASYHPNELKKGGTLNFGQYSQRKMLLHIDTLSPGPVHYNIKTERSQGISFTNQKKVFKKPSVSPGPGHYLPLEELHRQIGGIIPRTSREHYYDTETPGAGYYSLKSTLNEVGYKFKQLHQRTRTHQITPGPGQYSFHQDQVARGMKMHNSKRTWSYIMKTETPGPGTYTNESFTQRNSSRHSKTSSKDSSKIIKFSSQHLSKSKNTPSTNSKVNLDSSKQVTLRSKLQSNHLDSKAKLKDTENSYNRLKEYGKLKISFTKQVRKEEFLDEFSTPNPRKISRSPGPVIYADVKFKPSNKLGFVSKTKKNETFRPKEGPGVGSYNTSQQFGKVYNKHKAPKRKQYKFKDINQLDFDQ